MDGLKLSAEDAVERIFQALKKIPREYTSLCRYWTWRARLDQNSICASTCNAVISLQSFPVFRSSEFSLSLSLSLLLIIAREIVRMYVERKKEAEKAPNEKNLGPKDIKEKIFVKLTFSTIEFQCNW